MQIDGTDGDHIAVFQIGDAVRRHWRAIQKDRQRRGDFAKLSPFRRAMNDRDLRWKIGAGNAQIAAGDGTDDEVIRNHVEADGRSGAVTHLDANRRRGHVRSLL